MCGDICPPATEKYAQNELLVKRATEILDNRHWLSHIVGIVDRSEVLCNFGVGGGALNFEKNFFWLSGASE